GLEQGMKQGIERGIEQGIKKGKLEGKTEEKLDIARNMLKEGSKVDFISKVTKLSVSEIENLK
ncbi:MAG: hypothetical protein NC181_05540, partial [Clostridium sp.]|nr:hypothetical protein [Clostridium sp.]MCM1444699.1 hypothetical protein [Candidatus Amulumruptor caecigallinarius]